MVAQKNIIEGAAHGSSGASELKTRKAGLLTSAKKAVSTLSLAGAIFSAVPSFAVDEQFFTTNQSCVLQLGYYRGTDLITTDIKTTLSDLPSRLFRNTCGLRFKTNEDILQVPNIANVAYTTSSTLSYSIRPVSVDGVSYPWKYFPTLEQFFVLAEIAYTSGLREPVFEYQSDRYYNISFPLLFNELFFGTNTTFRASVLSHLSRVNSSLDNIYGDLLSVVANSDDSLAALRTLSAKYSEVNSVSVMPFTNFLSNAVNNGVFSQNEANQYLNRYHQLSGDDREYYARSIRDYEAAARNLSDLLNRVPDEQEGLEELGKSVNKGLQDALDSGFSASAHIQGATTNLLQKMTNMTEQIKKDLEAWRTDATNRLEQQLQGIKDVKDNTGDAAAGVTRIVNEGVKVNGPVQVVLGTDFLGVELKVGDIAELIQGFADGSDAAMQRWLDEWEFFKADQLPYMDRFSSFIRSNTNLLSSIEKRLDFGFTNTLGATYAFLTNGLESAISNGVAGIGLNLTNELWDYYFDRFQKANEFKDDEGQLFSSIDNQRRIVFGNGFDDSEYKKLDWFSRVELLLYQIGYASTNGTESIEASDLEGEFDDVSDEIQTAASAFEGAARRVVGVFSLVGRFAQAVKNAFADIAAPSTDGILLLEGGSWIVEEPLYLRIPVLIQNALRLVFQCVWYLSAFVIGWRLVSFAWGRVASLVRWLWSLIDV